MYLLKDYLKCGSHDCMPFYPSGQVIVEIIGNAGHSLTTSLLQEVSPGPKFGFLSVGFDELGLSVYCPLPAGKNDKFH